MLAETDVEGKAIASYTRADVLISQARGEERSYYLFDGHGDVRGLLDTEGNITDTYRYNAYGELLERDGDTENHYLYTGEYYDGTSNLYYLRARYMSPSTGTFISMDSYQGSIYESDTLHKYLYVEANPVMYTDPSGYTKDATLQETVLTLTIVTTLVSAVSLRNQSALNIFLDLRRNLSAEAVVSEEISVTQRDWKNAIIGFPSHNFDRQWIISFPAWLLSWELFEAIYAMDEEVNMISGVPAEVKEGPQIYDSKKSKETAKERATDIPTWAKGEKPKQGESGKDFAERLMNERYGKGNWEKNPQRKKEYSQLKKNGDRGHNHNK